MISVFELFKIGVGPSSSHTVGPMKAAAQFASGLVAKRGVGHVAAVEIALLGSLAFTGKGHSTDKAVMLGLSGQQPESVDPDAAEALVAEVRETKRLKLAGRRLIAFDPATAIKFDTLTPAPRHPNTLRLVAKDAGGAALADETWLSIGGGFIVRDGAGEEASATDAHLPYPFAPAPSFWRAGARLGYPLPRWCAPTRRRSGLKARSTPMLDASSTSCSPASTAGSRSSVRSRAGSR